MTGGIGGTGGAGGRSVKTYASGDLTVGATINVAVGTAGSGGSGGNNGNQCYYGSTGSGGTAGSVSLTWTDLTAPTVTTSAASSVKGNSATLNGSISATGGADATQHGFAYSTNSTLSTGVSTTTLGSKSGTGAFNQAISSLIANTTYYARAYATNSVGTGYGSIVNFFTQPLLTITSNVLIASNLDVRGSVSKGSGTFVIDHPLRPRTHLLYHSFVESPDAKNIYDGVAKLDENGEVTLGLPDYFEALNESFRYQYFPHYQPMPNLHIKEEVHDNQFTIGGGAPYGEISWQVTGNRKDPYIQANPIRVEVEKGPDQPVDKGEYLFPEYPQWESAAAPSR